MRLKSDDVILAVSILFLCIAWNLNYSVKSKIQQSCQSLNLTSGLLKDHDEDILIFLRVPKTASLAVNSLIERLRDRHNFTAFSKIGGMVNMAADEDEYIFEADPDLRKSLVDSILQEPSKPFIYTRHQNFFDFAEFYPNSSSRIQPLYFSLVRDPIDRLSSWYYYQRTYEKQLDSVGNLKNDLTSKEIKESFEECVLLQKQGCLFEPGMINNNYASQLSFFCGHDPKCQVFESRFAFARAKENLVKHFAVVGVTEFFKESLLLLERHLPRYFYNASQIFEETSAQLKLNRNWFKPKVSSGLKHRLAANFSLEIEFYEYAVQRFWRQFQCLA